MPSAPTGTPAAALSLRGNFVLLVAGTLRLLLPQADVGAAEHLGERRFAHAPSGLFVPGGAPRATPVVALSEWMQPLTDYPPERFLLTRLGSAGHDYLLAWDKVRVLIDVALELHLLPPVMRSPDGPVEGYVEIDGEPALCTTAQRLLGYAHLLREKVHG